MTSTFLPEGVAYFADVWARQRDAWAAGEVPAAPMRDGVTVPIDYCVSSVARLVEQPGAPIVQVEALVAQLRDAAPEQFFYPLESRHITLLGCTQRATTREAFSAEHMQRILECCRQAIQNASPVRLRLHGLSVVGMQAFLQVMPYDHAWMDLRQRVEDALLAIGESPMMHPIKTPIHMNIMRITDNDPAKVRRAFAAIEQLHEMDAGDWTVSQIDVLRTDFVISRSHTDIIGRIELAG